MYPTDTASEKKKNTPDKYIANKLMEVWNFESDFSSKKIHSVQLGLLYLEFWNLKS